MNEPTAWQGRPGQHRLPCPECGALRAADNTPSCACARRAAEALRDTREAEAAAAGDFDPLRIRPYVELDGEDGAGGAGGAGGASGTAAAPPADATPTQGVPAGDLTMPLRAVRPAGADARTTGFPSVSGPRPLNVHGGTAAADAYGDDDASHGRRRRPLLIAAAAGAVAVVAAVGFAGGLFTYDKPTRDSAAPEDVRAAVPEASPSADASESSSVSAPAPPADSPRSRYSSSPSASESPSPSASPSPSSAAPSASPSASPSPSAGPSSAAPPLRPGNAAAGMASPGASVLRPGDQGDEVTELELRLSQLALYDDKPDGVFTSQVEEALRAYQQSRGIQGDELGVYGQATRARLESETKEP
ncbi:peptidoglycan-binding domain-containing protein [Streptomyces sp. NPDC006172]|uniref:peptidoglycan-binding domain-containing protein n=1 Tax=Streptomyces sp. NPDC006172 TaxID=3154470 RepID=UPI00340CA9CD